MTIRLALVAPSIGKQLIMRIRRCQRGRTLQAARVVVRPIYKHSTCSLKIDSVANWVGTKNRGQRISDLDGQVPLRLYRSLAFLVISMTFCELLAMQSISDYAIDPGDWPK